MRDFAFFLLYILFVLQLITIRIFFPHIFEDPLVMSLSSGIAIFGAGFILSMTSEVAQKDMPRSLATIILALIAILPEYAVDIYLSYKASMVPEYKDYALANMTGANRLLVGLFWPLVVFAFFLKFKKKFVELKNVHLEIVFLSIFSFYAIFIAFKASITVLDSLILALLFFTYMYIASKQPKTEPELENKVLEKIASFKAPLRRLTITFLFAFSALGIVMSAEPFSEGLIHTGKMLGINEFFLVQWIAPLASESPELIVVMILVLRGFASWGISTLISSEVNQLSLLIATIPIAFSIGHGSIETFPLETLQSVEIVLVASLSIFGITIIIDRVFNIYEAFAMLTAFFITLVFPLKEVHALVSVVLLIVSAFMLLFKRYYVYWIATFKEFLSKL